VGQKRLEDGKSSFSVSQMRARPGVYGMSKGSAMEQASMTAEDKKPMMKRKKPLVAPVKP
jgi:hypothetical protein